MKVYFTASLHGKKYYLKNYFAIVDTLRSLGHTLFLNNLFDKEADQIWSQDKKTNRHFCQLLRGWLKKCELVIVEVSYPSTSVGMEIALALNSGRPVLAIYATDRPSPILDGLEGDHLLVQKYSLLNLESDIRGCIDYLKEKTEKRFTMILPSDIKSYLNQLSQKGLNRSEYIRHLIRQDIKRRKK